MPRPLRKSRQLDRPNTPPEFVGKSNVTSIDRRGQNQAGAKFVGECLGFCYAGNEILNKSKTIIKCVLPPYFVAILSIYATVDLDKLFSLAFAMLAIMLSAPLIISLVSIAKIEFKSRNINIFRGKLIQISSGSAVSTANTGLFGALKFELDKDLFDTNFKYLASSSYEESKNVSFGVLSSAVLVSTVAYMIIVCFIAISKITPHIT